MDSSGKDIPDMRFWLSFRGQLCTEEEKANPPCQLWNLDGTEWVGGWRHQSGGGGVPQANLSSRWRSDSALLFSPPPLHQPIQVTLTLAFPSRVDSGKAHLSPVIVTHHSQELHPTHTVHPERQGLCLIHLKNPRLSSSRPLKMTNNVWQMSEKHKWLWIPFSLPLMLQRAWWSVLHT